MQHDQEKKIWIRSAQPYMDRVDFDLCHTFLAANDIGYWNG